MEDKGQKTGDRKQETEDGRRMMDDGKSVIRESEELRVWNWLNVGCIGQNLKVKCVGRFISYLVNREAYLVRGKTA